MSVAGPSQDANGAPSGGSAAAPAASVGADVGVAGPPQDANGAPSGGSAAAQAASVGAPGAGPTLHVESAGAGPPLVLLHGWAMHGGLFAPLVPLLAQRHRVHVVDLPGHGHSAAVEPYTLDAIVARLDAAFARETQAIAVLGWSFGATAALRWARVSPARVARLVLVGATPRFVASADWAPAMASAALARFGDELRVAYRLTLQRFLTLQVQGSAEGRATLSALRGALFARGEPTPAVLAAALAVLAETDLRDDVRAIGAPALVVTGSRDALTPPAAGAWLAGALPRARLVAIENAAHAPFLSHRPQFGAAVTEFLDAA
jgi:pimeloyl-[acyl-carrier protein] methyl ester esterase